MSLPPLPFGWFCNGDIMAYRALAKALPQQAKLVEVGCFQGRSICSIADIILVKDLKVTLVDDFLDHAAQPGYKGAETRDKCYANLRQFNIYDKVVVAEWPSVKVAAELADASLDMVFLDADHAYESVKADIAAWLPKVKPGGLMAGHDYDGDTPYPKAHHALYCTNTHVRQHPGVKQAVDEAFPSAKQLPESFIWMASVGATGPIAH